MAAKNPTPMLVPSGNLTQRVKQINRWRDQFNPMRGLTMRRAVTLLESYALGRFTELMWAYGAPALGIETLDADLSALITRRTSAIKKLDWGVKLKSDETKGFDQALAERQEARLCEIYDGLDNLPQAIEHLCLGTFRGFSLLEKWKNTSGNIFHLEVVDHWNVVRDGSQGRWKYNPTAVASYFEALPGEPLPEEQFLIRTCARPINVIALLKYVRGNLGEKNWDAFLEIFGIPGGVVIMPPNVPTEREDEYKKAAEDIAQGGSGALPNGSTYTPNDSARGTQPFKDRLSHLTEKLILAGTGGKLTMLSSPTGIGGGASDQHEDVFDDIAQAEAADLSMIFQQQLDTLVLATEFPGQPQLAYFEICAREETDTSKFVEDVAKLSTAGYQVAPDQVEEKTGYKVTLKPVTVPPPVLSGPDAPEPTAPEEVEKPEVPMVNRAPLADMETFAADAFADVTGARREAFSQVSADMAEIIADAQAGRIDAEEVATRLEALAARMPELLTAENLAPVVDAMERNLGSAAVEGARAGVRKLMEVKKP